jgi:hypothetical protein
MSPITANREPFGIYGNWVATLLLLIATGGAQAARPMATDDTATAPAGDARLRPGASVSTRNAHK